jgi:hypothetical protein
LVVRAKGRTWLNARKSVDMKNASSGIAAPVDAMQIFSARPNPSVRAERPWVETRRFRIARPAVEAMMKRTLIRYKTKPELAEKTQR